MPQLQQASSNYLVCARLLPAHVHPFNLWISCRRRPWCLRWRVQLLVSLELMVNHVVSIYICLWVLLK